jgi:hypothetical protein
MSGIEQNEIQHSRVRPLLFKSIGRSSIVNERALRVNVAMTSGNIAGSSYGTNKIP